MKWYDNDAIAIKELIETNGDGSPNFEVISVLDECDAATFKDGISILFADDAEIILLYFSGHRAEAAAGYLCMKFC